jgi:hypothetical protein
MVEVTFVVGGEEIWWKFLARFETSFLLGLVFIIKKMSCWTKHNPVTVFIRRY